MTGDCGKRDPKVVHREQIDAFREKMRYLLEEYPRYDTDYSLLRWLHAYNFDEDVAARKLEWTAHALDALGVFDMDLSTVENIHKAVRASTPIAEYFPGGLLGYDKNGHMINMHLLGVARPRSMMDADRVSLLYIGALIETEGCMELIRAEEARREWKLGTTMIIDMSGFTYDILFQIPATKIYTNALLLLQTMFPDIARKLCIVNAPSVITALYKMVGMALSKETVSKFEFLGSNWREILVERHGAENLPVSCGGKLEADFLRRGGEVPESVKDSIEKKHYDAADLKKIHVNARDETRIPFTVDRPGSTLNWYFTCSSGNIDFCIVHQKREVWPNFRISTEFVPEFGSIVCKKSGVYELRFSNKHGKIWGKAIHYRVDIEPPMKH